MLLWLSRRRRGEEQRDDDRYGRESAPSDADLLDGLQDGRAVGGAQEVVGALIQSRSASSQVGQR